MTRRQRAGFLIGLALLAAAGVFLSWATLDSLDRHAAMNSHLILKAARPLRDQRAPGWRRGGGRGIEA